MFDPKEELDAIIKAIRIANVNPLTTAWTPYVLYDAITFADNTTKDFYIPMDGKRYLGWHFVPTGTHFEIKLHASGETGNPVLSSCQYVDKTLKWHGAASFTAEALECVDVPKAVHSIHLEVSLTGNGGDGTLQLWAKTMW